MYTLFGVFAVCALLSFCTVLCFRDDRASVPMTRSLRRQYINIDKQEQAQDSDTEQKVQAVVL